jgi:hypothetical protein
MNIFTGLIPLGTYCVFYRNINCWSGLPEKVVVKGKTGTALLEKNSKMLKINGIWHDGNFRRWYDSSLPGRAR